MPHTFPRNPVPKIRAQIHPNISNIPRLEIPQFDSLSLRNELSEFLGDAESKIDPSSLRLSGFPEHYTGIRDIGPEWDSTEDDSGEYTMDLSPSKMRYPFSSETMRRDRLPCPPPPSPEIKRPSDEKGLSLEDFLVNLVPPDNQVGTCIRRSDGRIYAIKKVLQTQQTWTELAILDRIKRIRNSFCPLLHWTFERGHYIYLIMDNYPGGTLTDAIERYGMFGPLDVFFYACEIIMGLRFLHDVGIVHRNVSPDTIIFNRRGHIILSSLENGAILQPRRKDSQDTQATKNQYQAPELLLGWRHDFLVDAWSFGMVLYYMFHGKHALIVDPKQECDVKGLTQKLVGESVPSRAIQFINPIARDLISKCIERNPAMRVGVREIQHHPYFSNADWRIVVEQKTLAPLPRSFRVSAANQSSESPCRAIPSLEQCFSPRVSAFGLGNRQRSFGQAIPQSLSSPFVTPEMRDRISNSLSRPVAQSVVASDPICSAHGSDSVPGENQEDKDTSYATEEFRTDDTDAPPKDIWEILDREERLSLHSDCSATSVMKTPFSESRDLRKERSLICPQKLFSLSMVSIPQRLRRKQKSVTALKCASYAEPIVDLPRGLNQMGSGIGYTCTAPPRTPTALKTSAVAGYDRAVGTRASVGVSRASVSSDFTVAVPKACQGLIHSLSMSSLWTGFKSQGGTIGLPATLVSPDMKEVSEGASDSFSATDGSPFWKKHEATEESPSGIIRPLAESTAIISPSRGSPSETLSITSSTATEEAILTPDTIEFPQQGVVGVGDMGQERSEKLFGLEPESTLRLVTPFSALRFSFTSEG
ncbi:hypothetical protein Agabi119p4_998 [Agaricus bisporus var. burnettii]|uniref:Protein kinase domain-containing protein n=1 Tax=Agaricus bisporus var. burnettii TaxID=192524 RepID=A0A8H7FC53_AGABI|nr:hypothetical protein Agabi119p4_998 [Agaricus bisporus var. burnettii]